MFVLLQSCGSVFSSHHSLIQVQPRPFRTKPKTATFVCVGAAVTDSIAQIAHNKVLVAAVASMAIGQLSKPFTSVILYGNKFEFKTAFQPGGFPSSHSSATVATAMSLGLERGFSDAIFGLAVVYAGLTMYDAQGVRREVGIHAKELNRVLLNNRLNSISSRDAVDGLIDSSSAKSSTSLESNEPRIVEEPNSFRPKQTKVSLLLRSDKSLAADVKGGSENVAHSKAPLKEAVGHTEIEVIAGALLGFLVSLAVNA